MPGISRLIGAMKRLLLIALFLATAIAPIRAQWVQTNGPNAGEISCFATMGSNVFAGTWDAGVFRSTDSGKTWKTSSSFTDIYCLSIIGERLIAANTDGVFFSTDSGVSWYLSSGIPGGAGFGGVRSILPIDGKLFVSDIMENYWCTTYISRDSGKSWTTIGNPPGVIQTLVVNSGNILAGTDRGLYVSSDTGHTWSSTGNSLKDSSIYSLVFSDSIMFAMTGDGYDSGNIYVSTDSGMNWTPTSFPHLGFAPFAQSAMELTNGTSLLFVGGSKGVLRSTDLGQTWSPAGLDSVSVVEMTTHGSWVFAGTYLGLYLSTDLGTTWNYVGVPSSDITCLAGYEHAIYAGTTNDLYTGTLQVSSDDGNHWGNTNISSQKIMDGVYSIAQQGSIIVGSATGSFIFRSIDSGSSWMFGSNSFSALGARSFVINGTSIFAACDYDKILLSTDSGANWSIIDSSFNNSDQNLFINSIGIRDSTILAATSDAGIIRSNDNGVTWSRANIVDSNTTAVLATGSDLVAGGNPDGIFISSDDGEDWILVHALEGRYIYSFAAVGTNIFAATDSDVYLSQDKGNSWASVSLNLPDKNINSLVIVDSEVFVGTRAEGVWRRPLSEMITTSAVSISPTESQSLSVYPNPALGSITITGIVGSVTIYDPMGRSYSVPRSGNIFDVSSLPSGVYIVSDGLYRTKFLKQ